MKNKSVNIGDLMNADIGYSDSKTPIDTIIDRMSSGTYFIPKHQKKYVWEEKIVIYLVVSLLKNIPIPSIYMYYNINDYRYNIINGQQRIVYLFFFMKGVFPISIHRTFYYKFDVISELIDKHGSSKSQKEKKEIEVKLENSFGLEFKEFSYLDLNNDKNVVISYQAFGDDIKRLFNNRTLNLVAVDVKKDSNDILSIYDDISILLNRFLIDDITL